MKPSPLIQTYQELRCLSPDRDIVKNKDDYCEIKPVKSISYVGSFALIVNNCLGPGMVALPHLFQRAGVIPVILSIIFFSITSTLGSSLLAETISKLPGNRKFDRSISYSSAFRIIMGEEAYILAESLFLISCGVQAVAAIIVVAQSIDSLLASLVMGHAYALQVFPSVQFISWSPYLCDDSVISQQQSSCIPFGEDGPMLISLGFVITTAMFLPFGRGLLTETIILQVVVLTIMVILLITLEAEFVIRGLSVQLPWFGGSSSEVAGVVLFNYAFTPVVAAWLTEKEPHVSVNNILWSSTSFSSVIYIVFGLLGAMSFHKIGGNSLVILTSSQVM